MRSVACATLALADGTEGGGRTVGAREASDSAAVEADADCARACSESGVAAMAAAEPAAAEPAAAEPVAAEPAAGIPADDVASACGPLSDPSSSEGLASGGGNGGGMGVRAAPLASSDVLLARAVPPLSVDRRVVISVRVSGVTACPRREL
jgi:hypothetical protein